MRRSTFFLLSAAILLLTWASHVFFIGQTAWDWDEPVYVNIAQNTCDLGYPALRTAALEDTEQPDFYPYHPPFHFGLLCGWFQLTGLDSVVGARLLSSLAAVAIVAISMVIVKMITQDEVTALLAGLVLATDGWFTYSSLLVKLDVVALLLGAIGIYWLAQSMRRESIALSLVAGLIIGVAVSYKHVAVIFFLAILFHWILTKKHARLHMVILGTAAAVLVLYVVGMITWAGDPYVEATTVQLRRTLGLQEARGLNYGLDEAIQALSQTYWAFTGTLILLGGGILCTLWKAWLHWRGHQHQLAPVTAWALAALVVLAGVRLRNPHYLIYLIPELLIGVIQISQWLASTRVTTRIATLVIVGVCFLNGVTFAIRAVSFAQVNALEVIAEFMAERLPADAVVVSEEPICAMVAQPCYRIGLYQTASRLQQIQPEVLVIYTSITQRPPSSPAIQELVSQGVVLFQVSGWKETITVISVEKVSLEDPVMSDGVFNQEDQPS